MFSATLHSDEVRDIAKRICHQPILVDLKARIKLSAYLAQGHSQLLETSVFAVSFPSFPCSTLACLRPCR